jgi:hypothetical protein
MAKVMQTDITEAKAVPDPDEEAGHVIGAEWL